MSVEDVIREYYETGWTVTSEEVAISQAIDSHGMKDQELADQLQKLVQANRAIEADEYLESLTLADLEEIVRA
jgi:ribosome-binding protein aMBF1 (putative translation factor)